MLKSRVLVWPDHPRGLHVLEPQPNDIFDLTREECRDMLINAVPAHKPRLIVVDSLSRVSSRGENSIDDVRQIMAFLTAGEIKDTEGRKSRANKWMLAEQSHLL